MQFRKAPEGSPRKIEAQKQFVEAMSHRMHLDNSVKLIGKLLFGIEKGPEVLTTVRPAGRPLVDDWDCLKTLVILPILSLSLTSVKLFFYSILRQWCVLINHICRWELLRHIVDPYPNMGWNTCAPLQTSVMLGLRRSRWLTHRLKLVLVFLLGLGALCTRDSVHDWSIMHNLKSQNLKCSNLYTGFVTVLYFDDSPYDSLM